MNSSHYSRQTLHYLEHFANVLQVARKTRKITIKDLAFRCGVGRSVIGRALQGDPTVRIGIYFQMAVVLEVPLFEQEPGRFQELKRKTSEHSVLLPERVTGNKKIDIDDNF